MARETVTIQNKANWGKEMTAMRQQFAALVDEMEELKANFLIHEHSALDAAPDVGVTFTATEAKKVA